MLAVQSADAVLRTAQGEPIRVIKTPSFPEFRFEWHRKAQRVYLVRIGQVPEIGEIVAFDIENEGAATNAVLIWLRGYRAAQGYVRNESGTIIDKRTIA